MTLRDTELSMYNSITSIVSSLNTLQSQLEILILSEIPVVGDSSELRYGAAFSPSSGYGGTVVTISGSAFTGATAVTFGHIPAISFTVNSDVQITATSPALGGGGGDVNVTVTTPAGTSAIADYNVFECSN